MIRHVDGDKRPLVFFFEIKESGAEPFFRSEVALARVPCQRETCAVQDDDLQREVDE